MTLTDVTTIHLMRHGEVHNPQGLLYGRLPGFSLSDLGMAMAREVGGFLCQRNVSLIVASPLLRAQQSAAPSAAAHNLPVRSDARLIESGNFFEGMAINKDRSMLASPRFWWRYRNPLRPSWGEPYTHMVDRMRAAVSDALAQARGREALLVSHQLPIWALRRWLEGRPLAHDPRARQCSLASLTSLTFSGNTLVSLSYSEPAGHLLPAASDMVPGTSKAALRD